MEEITLALGGGGVKGFSHVGTIRALEAAGYTISAIAGTSAGAMVGGLYAAGYDTHELEEIINKSRKLKLFNRHPDDSPSLLGLDGLHALFHELLGNRTFDDLNIPFSCTAVDMKSGQEVALAQGIVVDAIMASIAIPGVFPARQIGNALLIDGGVLNPVPVTLARWLNPGTPVVAICLTPVPEGWGQIPSFHIPSVSAIPGPILHQIGRLRISQAFQHFVRSSEITANMLTELRLQSDRPDVIIRPVVSEYGFLDDVNPQELISRGEQAVHTALESIRQAYSWRHTIARRFHRPDPPTKILSTEVK